MMNTVILVGRIARHETRPVNERKVSNFTLATQRNFKNKGTNEYESDFNRCVSWSDYASTLQVGDLVAVRGRLTTRSYEKDGVRHSITEVVVDEISMLAKNKKANGTGNAPVQNENDANNGAESFMDISGDDSWFTVDDGELPF